MSKRRLGTGACGVSNTVWCVSGAGHWFACDACGACDACDACGACDACDAYAAYAAKYTQENGARRKQVLRAKCNMCNFCFHRDCLQPVMTDATADTGCFFACSKECIEEVNENLLSDQNGVQVL